MKTLQILFIAAFGAISVSGIPLEHASGNIRLIKISDEEPAKWLTEDEIWALIEKDQKFMDITDLDYFPDKALKVSHTFEIPTNLSYQHVVRQTYTSISLTRIESFISRFSRFFNRYFNDTLGVESEQWLLSQVNSSVVGYPGQITVTEYNHNTWLQNSIIARVEGTDPVLRSEVVILGAHQDSINASGASLKAPGADDNASGCIVLLEALRAIVAAEIVPERSIEFHWYAGEERGLLGSLDIARAYKQAGVNVTGMINFDVVGYYVDGNDDVAIITDYVDGDLTEFLRVIVDGYLDFGRRERDCGYACSDHAAWSQNGYPAARPTQAVRNGQMHTVNDTIETVSFVQVREFVKVAIGFAVELAVPYSWK